MSSVPELFGTMVFNDSVMRARVPKISYREFCRAVQAGEPLSPALADVIAGAMKDWAVEKGTDDRGHRRKA